MTVKEDVAEVETITEEEKAEVTIVTQTLVEETLVIITIVNKRTIAVRIIEEEVEEVVEEEVEEEEEKLIRVTFNAIIVRNTVILPMNAIVIQATLMQDWLKKKMRRRKFC